MIMALFVADHERRIMDLLSVLLECSVNLRMLELAKLNPKDLWEQFRSRREYLTEQIAAHGDDLQFGGKHCASTFNALAEAISYGAFVPGGITFLGQHWEHKNPVLCGAFFTGFALVDNSFDGSFKTTLYVESVNKIPGR